MTESAAHARVFFNRSIRWVSEHKFKAGLALLVIAGIGYWQYGKTTTTTAEAKAVIALVERGTLVTSVSGSGQVSAETQIDVKPKVSGEIVRLAVSEGQHVAAGQTLVQLDSADAQKVVRDAQVSLDSAQLSLTRTQQSSADIASILENSFAEISNSFLDFPAIVTGAQDIIVGSTISPGRQDNIGFYKDFVGQMNDVGYQKVALFIDSAFDDYTLARSDYDAVLLLYKETSRSSSPADIQLLLDSTIRTSKDIAQALQSEENLLDFLSDYATTHNKTTPAIFATYKTNLRSYIQQVNGHLSSLSSAANNIKNAPLDIQSAQLSLEQRKNALLDAQTNLANYYVRAPFDGIVAKLPVKKGDSVGSGTAIATMVSPQQLASITLNEVDVAKAKIGQKATLTFDAAPDLTLVGSVVRIDTIGTVSQGVVTYTVTIAFDALGQGIKPGMSVSAAIITQTKPDVLLVPSSAVKSQGAEAYVEVPAAAVDASSVGSSAGVVLAGAVKRVTVQTGVSNDTMIEITGGLNESDQVITRTIITASTPAAAAGGVGGIRIPGISGGR